MSLILWCYQYNRLCSIAWQDDQWTMNWKGYRRKWCWPNWSTLLALTHRDWEKPQKASILAEIHIDHLLNTSLECIITPTCSVNSCFFSSSSNVNLYMEVTDRPLQIFQMILQERYIDIFSFYPCVLRPGISSISLQANKSQTKPPRTQQMPEMISAVTNTFLALP
jgi:hypothetical protein